MYVWRNATVVGMSRLRNLLCCTVLAADSAAAAASTSPMQAHAKHRAESTMGSRLGPLDDATMLV